MPKTIDRIKREILIRYAYLKKIPRVSYPPSFIAIEPTNCCNYKCIMCPQSSEKAGSIHRGFMDEETFGRILNEIKHYALEVFIQLGGEPILHPKLLEFIKKAKGEDLVVGISTNASLLTRELGKGLIDAGLDKLVITFTDRGKEKYERVWQGGDYEKVQGNIREVLDLKQGRRKPLVTLQIIKFFGEDKDLILDKEFSKTWRKLGVYSFSPVWATYWAGDFRDEAMCRYREAPRDKYYSPCGAIWRSLAVHWDGNVSPCCNDLTGEYILGNIETVSIRDIWNSEKMVRLREDLARGGYKKIKLCRNCLALWGRLPSEKRRWCGILENRIKKIA